MTTYNLEEIAANSDAKIDKYGERFFDLPAKSVTKGDLKELKGLELQAGIQEVTVAKINKFEADGYENVDGLFIRIEVDATFKYLAFNDEPAFEDDGSFVIWISAEDGGEIEVTDIEPGGDGTTFTVDPERLDAILNRFEV